MKKKEKEYFSHDYNTRDDEKIMDLMGELGWAGYGQFWGIIELLYKNEGKMRTQYERIAFALNSHPDAIKTIVEKFGLFQVKNSFFSSASVTRRLRKRNEKSDAARANARKRWENNDAGALRPQCDSNAIKEKERKEKEIKNIYNAYPTKCVVDGRPLGKSKSHHTKIKSLLKSHPEGELLSTIQRYISECRTSQTFMMNFGTFLNNLPDYESPETPPQKWLPADLDPNTPKGTKVFDYDLMRKKDWKHG